MDGFQNLCKISVPCPETHPYAYYKGLFCCKYDEDMSGMKHTDGTTNTCKDGEYVECEDGAGGCIGYVPGLF